MLQADHLSAAPRAGRGRRLVPVWRRRLVRTLSGNEQRRRKGRAEFSRNQNAGRGRGRRVLRLASHSNGRAVRQISSRSSATLDRFYFGWDRGTVRKRDARRRWAHKGVASSRRRGGRKWKSSMLARTRSRPRQAAWESL